MSAKRILAVAFVLVAIGAVTLLIAQASAPKAQDPRPARSALNPAIVGNPHFPKPCEMDMGLNYLDGKLHGTPSPGQIGVNYIDGKVHKNDIPLFTPDDWVLCSH